jgi:hypothetical protein
MRAGAGRTAACAGQRGGIGEGTSCGPGDRLEAYPLGLGAGKVGAGKAGKMLPPWKIVHYTH